MARALATMMRGPDEQDGDVPEVLRRPSSAGAVARLSWTPEKDGAREELPARWYLRGVVDAVALAERLFSPCNVTARRDAASWPDVNASFPDLLMLMRRYPTEVDPEAEGAFRRRLDAAQRTWRLKSRPVEDLLASRKGRFRGELQAFQAEGVRFLLAHSGALLADDMGLGKTVQALAFLDALDAWPVAIVCQSHVQTHWERKIVEFLECENARKGLLAAGARLSFLSLRGLKPSRETPRADIYILHYLAAHSWKDLLIGRLVKAVIFDEAQELRHQGTRKFEANRDLARRAANVVGLSGTPIYNKGIEIFNVLNVLERGCLGAKVSFQEKWCSSTDPAVVAEPDALGRYLTDRGLMLRRRKEDVLAELPPKRRVIEPIDADDGTFRELVKEAVKLAREAELQGNSFAQGQMEATAIAKLRKATGVSKVPAAVAFLRGLMEAGQPTLVFAHHHAVHDAICDALEEFRPARITGEESLAVKDESRRRFIDGETDLCLIALRAATGIDGLQARARVVVHVEMDWSPAVHAQAEDRAYRFGQKDSVLVYYLTTELGSDPFVMGALSLKERQFLGLMNDRAETEEDARAARDSAERHKAEMLAALRGGRL
jgi:SNF2 family DNA or RNA helicase